MTVVEFSLLAAELQANARHNSYAGYDPFDGLNSRFFKASPLYRWPLARLAWIQLFKRSPLNFRPLALVPRMRNPKGVALFILGMLEDYRRTREPELLAECQQLAEWLLGNRCDVEQWPNACWGYHFDWQAKAFYVPVGKPNVITTWYVARALHALFLQTGDVRFQQAFHSAAHFVYESLLTEHEGRRFIAYIPGERAFVHNASLWGAAFLVLAGKDMEHQAMVEAGLEVARYSVGMQASDGSWRYGTMPHHGFIDGFHTGYNLEALDLIAKTLGITEFEAVIAKGMAYYRQHFFTEDGAAKYYNNNLYPLDMHSFAQAAITFLVVGDRPYDAALSERVLAWAVRHMYIPSKGRFYYQVGPLWRNSIDYSRWTQAWSYYALALYNRYACDEGND